MGVSYAGYLFSKDKYSGSKEPMSQAVLFQGKIATTGTTQELPANALQNYTLTLTAKSTNTAALSVLNSSTGGVAVDGTGAGYILEKGTSLTISVLNTNALWIAGTSGDIFSGVGS